MSQYPEISNWLQLKESKYSLDQKGVPPNPGDIILAALLIYIISTNNNKE